MSFNVSFQAREAEEVGESHIRTVGWLRNCWHIWIGHEEGHEEFGVGRPYVMVKKLDTVTLETLLKHTWHLQHLHKSRWQIFAQSSAASRLERKTLTRFAKMSVLILRIVGDDWANARVQTNSSLHRSPLLWARCDVYSLHSKITEIISRSNPVVMKCLWKKPLI